MAENPTDFNDVASRYDADLDEGLSATGYGKDYFAVRRVEYLSRLLRQLGLSDVHQAIDFGCGTGTSCPLLKSALRAESVIGLDPSEESLRIAGQAYGAECRFSDVEAFTPTGDADLVFSNGVFHHIPVSERAEAMARIRAMLRPDGLFALWENNPWNPGTRYVMRRVPFDRDAETLSPRATKQLLRDAGFTVLAQRSLFFFPRLLRALTPVERFLAVLPLGGQYLTLGQAQE